MSKQNKLIECIKSNPSDFTYRELKTLLSGLGYEEQVGGKTSGSFTAFYNEKNKHLITIHKPHPKKEFGKDTLKKIVNQLIEKGII